MEIGGSIVDDKTRVMEGGAIGDESLGGLVSVPGQRVYTYNGRGEVAGDSEDKAERGKMRGRDKTLGLEGGGKEKIEEG